MNRVKRIKKQQPPTSPLRDDEVIGIDNQFVTNEIVHKYVKTVPVALANLQQANYLLTHPSEFDQTPPAAVKGQCVNPFIEAIDKEFRRVQEENLREKGKARP